MTIWLPPNFLVLISYFTYGFAQLVGAGGVLPAAANAFQAVEHILHLHPFHQTAYALGVAVAPPYELNMMQLPINDFEIYRLAACTLGLISVSHFFWFFLVLLVILERLVVLVFLN
jgi:hypothetical protein